MASIARATLDDLYAVEEKAELIDGRIVKLMPSGAWPSEVAFYVTVSLREHARVTKRGKAYAGGAGYAVPELASGRESFSPDASYYDGPQPANPMRFIEGPPTFAAEVRSENDYGDPAEADLAAKRADYFEAGTLAVWDVDPIQETVMLYRQDEPTRPMNFRRGETAHAEPAVPGWRMAVDEVFTS